MSLEESSLLPISMMMPESEGGRVVFEITTGAGLLFRALLVESWLAGEKIDPRNWAVLRSSIIHPTANNVGVRVSNSSAQTQLLCNSLQPSRI